MPNQWRSPKSRWLPVWSADGAQATERNQTRHQRPLQTRLGRLSSSVEMVRESPRHLQRFRAMSAVAEPTLIVLARRTNRDIGSTPTLPPEFETRPSATVGVHVLTAFHVASHFPVALPTNQSELASPTAQCFAENVQAFGIGFWRRHYLPSVVVYSRCIQITSAGASSL